MYSNSLHEESNKREREREREFTVCQSYSLILNNICLMLIGFWNRYNVETSNDRLNIENTGWVLEKCHSYTNYPELCTRNIPCGKHNGQ